MTRHGICHLCGREDRLSYEHVPPRAAFNSRPLVATALDELLGMSGNLPKGQIFQRGAGAYTLCFHVIQELADGTDAIMSTGFTKA
jgi:hypothetical protein